MTLHRRAAPNQTHVRQRFYFLFFFPLQGLLIGIVNGEDAIGPTTLDRAGNIIELRWISWGSLIEISIF